MKGNIIRERLTKLRKCMKEKGVDALYIPTSDFHSSEYAGGYFRCRKYLPSVQSPASSCKTSNVPAEPVKPEKNSLQRK